MDTHPLGWFAPEAPQVVAPLSEEGSPPVVSETLPVATNAEARVVPATPTAQADPAAVVERAVVSSDDYLRGGRYRPEESPSVYRSFVQTLIRERIC